MPSVVRISEQAVHAHQADVTQGRQLGLAPGDSRLRVADASTLITDARVQLREPKPLGGGVGAGADGRFGAGDGGGGLAEQVQ